MKNGKYTLIVCPQDYPGKRYRGRYAYEHIVEFWRKENRLPQIGHVIHHLNGDHRDNSWENLEEILKSDHSRNHQLEKPINHGTHSGYRRGCRCIECKDFHAKEHQAYRLRKKASLLLQE